MCRAQRRRARQGSCPGVGGGATLTAREGMPGSRVMHQAPVEPIKAQLLQALRRALLRCRSCGAGTDQAVRALARGEIAAASSEAHGRDAGSPGPQHTHAFPTLAARRCCCRGRRAGRRRGRGAPPGCGYCAGRANVLQLPASLPSAGQKGPDRVLHETQRAPARCEAGAGPAARAAGERATGAVDGSLRRSSGPNAAQWPARDVMCRPARRLSGRLQGAGVRNCDDLTQGAVVLAQRTRRCPPGAVRWRCQASGLWELWRPAVSNKLSLPDPPAQVKWPEVRARQAIETRSRGATARTATPTKPPPTQPMIPTCHSTRRSPPRVLRGSSNRPSTAASRSPVARCVTGRNTNQSDRLRA